MTTRDLAELMRTRSRGNYESMAALARALYEAGRTEREVLRECYGVAFPDELFVIALARAQQRVPPALYTNQPWNLAIPLARGGPPPSPNAINAREMEAFALDPALVPLLILQNPDYRHGDALLCYRLDELAAGRSTIVGLPRDIDDTGGPRRHGDSLLAVMREHYADAVRRLDQELHGPHNRGAGALDRDEVDAAHEALALVDDLDRAALARP